MSTVNLAEVLSRLKRDGHDLAEAMQRLDRLSIEWIDFDRSQAEIVAALLPATRPAGLSLGDRACLALAMSRGATALTTDRAWGRLGLDVQVEVLR
ncbi:MAG: PIN domain-containing protein [Alphaproteobacteria bacterium]|nr:PIN domain-containing protein [Alphaproteobacteria bacterium]